jgi:acyl carrier protein
MEMDLEADLSIDSIKRVEIIGTLRNELGTLAKGNTNEDMVMEQLAGIKTLSGLVSWLTEFSGADATTATEKTEPAEAASKPQAKSALSLEDLQNAILNIVRKQDIRKKC